MDRVAIIVLNWNNAADTLACLKSVAGVDYPALEVIVVDNGSSDDSVACIVAEFPHIRLIETGDNLGYAGGNNVGVRHALAEGIELICILNNDTIVEPGFLWPLVSVLHTRPDVGIVTPLVAEQSAYERVWALGAKVNWRTAAVAREHACEPVAAWRSCAPYEVEVASGAAMVIKRTVYQAVGFMDEGFFLYFEETDWCLRLRQSGIRIVAVPQSVVRHKVSATLGQKSPIIDYYMTRNHLLFIRQHWTGPRQHWLWWRTIARHLLAVGAFTVKPHSGQRIPRRNARLFALRDALQGRWGKMGSDVATRCCLDQK